MGVVKAHVIGVEALDDLQAIDQRGEGLAAIAGFMHAAAGHGHVEVLGVPRVDDDGVQLGAVGGAVLHGAHPFAVRGRR
jgi:hypothetical protein